MRILVTNDDGIAAPGLRVAEAIAQEVAGPDGEVWVAAPAFEQSGVSHAVTFHSPIKVERLSERRFACAGTPADCVVLALYAFMADHKPDLVLSGVNRGHNLAEDAVYSGTLGGAIEGALHGVRAIAVSQAFSAAAIRRALGREADADGPPDLGDDAAQTVMFATARAHGAATVRRILDEAPWEPDLYFNVNFPPVAEDAVKGALYTAQGRRRDGAFTPEARVSPGGRAYYWLQHRVDNRSAAPATDAHQCADGWITMVPMKPDYTDAALLARLNAGG